MYLIAAFWGGGLWFWSFKWNPAIFSTSSWNTVGHLLLQVNQIMFFFQS